MAINADNYDHEIVRLLDERKPKSITLLYQYHYDEVLTRIYTLVLNREDAEDIAQELFLNIWIKGTSLNLSFPLRAYLLTAAANKTLNFLEAKGRLKATFNHLPSITTDVLDKNTSSDDRKILRLYIQQAVHRLPHKTRIVFILSKNFNMTNIQIAQHLNRSVKTVEKHMAKAISLLQVYLKQTVR